MKKAVWLLLAALLALGAGVTAYAENSDKVADYANLLDEKEEQRLEEQFKKTAEKYQCDVAVVTTDSLGGKTPMNFTDDYYYSNGYGYGEELDGIMLMVSMEDRDWWMATRGKAIRVFTDYGLNQISKQFLGDLGDGAYYEAFSTFGEMAERFLAEEKKGTPYDTNHTYKAPMSMGVRLAISAVAGLISAAAVCAVLFSQLRSVRVKPEAREYVRSGSFRLTRSHDLFLYRTVDRRKVEQETSHGSGGGSSTHSTSGGGRAGGTGGKF